MGLIWYRDKKTDDPRKEEGVEGVGSYPQGRAALGEQQIWHISCEWKEGENTAQVQRVDGGERRWTFSFDVLTWK